MPTVPNGAKLATMAPADPPARGTTFGAEYAYKDVDTGRLRLVEWAMMGASDDARTSVLHIDLGMRSVPMASSNETGEPLVSNGFLGVDLIRVEAGTGFQPHTHPGDHLLIVVGGEGTITYDGFVYPTHAGQVYMVEGAVPHAVGAITDHVILAVGAPHKPVGSTERMQPVEYKEIVASFNDLACLVCGASATYPALLHDHGCEHCPCASCAIGANPNHTHEG